MILQRYTAHNGLYGRNELSSPRNFRELTSTLSIVNMTGFTRFYWSSVVLSGSRISIGVSICVMVRMTIWPSYLFVWNGPCSTWNTQTVRNKIQEAQMYMTDRYMTCNFRYQVTCSTTLTRMIDFSNSKCPTWFTSRSSVIFRMWPRPAIHARSLVREGAIYIISWSLGSLCCRVLTVLVSPTASNALPTMPKGFFLSLWPSVWKRCIDPRRHTWEGH